MADQLSKWRDFLVECAKPRRDFVFKATGRLSASKMARAFGISPWTVNRILRLQRHVVERTNENQLPPAEEYDPGMRTKRALMEWCRIKTLEGLDERVADAEQAPSHLLPKDAP